MKEADLRNKSYEKLEERFISQITKIESSNKDYMDEIDANKNQMKKQEDHNSQLKRDLEKTCEQSKQTIINLNVKIQSNNEVLDQQKKYIKEYTENEMKTNQKIQNLVKQLEDKDREGKNQINTIQKENAKQLERIKKENQSLNEDKRKNLALIKEYEIQDN